VGVVGGWYRQRIVYSGSGPLLRGSIYCALNIVLLSSTDFWKLVFNRLSSVNSQYQNVYLCGWVVLKWNVKK
jgi:hypothetical protein